MNILFTYLVAFSGNGGIQKFNRCFIKALAEISEDNKLNLTVSSIYDINCDDRYIEPSQFKGYKKYKLWYIFSTILQARKYDVIILGHINIAMVGLFIKWLFPKTKVILIAHGIEVWKPLNFWGRNLLKKTDMILAVSEFTKSVILKINPIDSNKIHIFHNTIDPYFRTPSSFDKPDYLLKKYDIKENEKVIVTIARLSAFEKYKGYDHVIEILSSLQESGDVKYIICGKYDNAEEQRISHLIKNHGVENKVILTGYISDFQLADHYLMADVFIMPSKKEGFGIVFIEAMVCGLPVIAGNKDGSVDALLNGKLGLLVDPDNIEEIHKALKSAVEAMMNAENKKLLQIQAIEEFGFKKYKTNLLQILENIKD